LGRRLEWEINKDKNQKSYLTALRGENTLGPTRRE